MIPTNELLTYGCSEDEWAERQRQSDERESRYGIGDYVTRGTPTSNGHDGKRGWIVRNPKVTFGNG